MRWHQLFADLQAQFDEAATAAERAETASRARAEVAAVRLADRIRGALGDQVQVRCLGGGAVSGVLADVGADWLLLADERGREVVIPTTAVLAVTGLGRRTAEEEAVVRARRSLRLGLRALARDRRPVQVGLQDGAVGTGTIDRGGADFLEVAEHPPEEPRRAGTVQGVQAVVIGAVALVREVLPALD